MSRKNRVTKERRLEEERQLHQEMEALPVQKNQQSSTDSIPDREDYGSDSGRLFQQIFGS